MKDTPMPGLSIVADAAKRGDTANSWEKVRGAIHPSMREAERKRLRGAYRLKPKTAQIGCPAVREIRRKREESRSKNGSKSNERLKTSEERRVEAGPKPNPN